MWAASLNSERKCLGNNMKIRLYLSSLWGPQRTRFSCSYKIRKPIIFRRFSGAETGCKLEIPL